MNWLLLGGLLAIAVPAGLVWLWRWEDRKLRAEAIRQYGPISEFDVKVRGFRPYGFPGPSYMPPHKMPGR